MSNNPLVSVVIPTYNRSSIVGDAIDSALLQTYGNIEVVVVDDGSTDDTLLKVTQYGDRIRVITQDNAGPSAARNRGIAVSRGELIAFLDSDDLWMRTKVERQVSLLLKAGNSVPCCLTNIRMQWNDREISSFENSWLRPGIEEGIWLNVSDVLATRFVLFNQAVMIRREALDRVGGFDESLRLLEDSDLALRLSFDGPWAFIREPLVIWRETAGSCYQEAKGSGLRPQETLIKVLEGNLSKLNDGELQTGVRKRLAVEVKRVRRELRASQMRRVPSWTTATAGRLLQTIEQCGRAVFRRSPLFPKMKVQPLRS